MTTAQYRSEGRVALITLDNPPVNGLAHDVRRAIADGVDCAADDAAIDAIVLTGGAERFSGGADIREFDTPKAKAEPTTRAMLDANAVTMRPLWKPTRKSSYASAFANQRNDSASGGKANTARALKAAIATTRAGNSTKARVIATMATPIARSAPQESISARLPLRAAASPRAVAPARRR